MLAEIGAGAPRQSVAERGRGERGAGDGRGVVIAAICVRPDGPDGPPPKLMAADLLSAADAFDGSSRVVLHRFDRDHIVIAVP